MSEFITPYRYFARPERFVDGDTLVMTTDLGFWIHFRRTFRLSGIDTAEIHFVSHDSKEYQLGQEHLSFVENWFLEAEERSGEEDWPVVVQTEKDEQGKYGRYLADFNRRDTKSGWEETSLAEALVEEYGDEVKYE